MRLQPVTAGGTVALDGSPYRGAMRVLDRGGRLSAVNVVNLEQYLYGVVPREVSASWGDDAPAALRAQAIAARSYAIATLDRGADYDLLPDERDQVYGGAAAEDPAPTPPSTRRGAKVLVYGGGVITAYFFSSSGGPHGGRAERLPGGRAASPTWRACPDPFDRGSPFHTWSARTGRTFTGAALGRAPGRARRRWCG